MIEFTSVEYKNLQSVGNHPIKIDLTASPTTVIGGQNGSGKSTMLAAIAYGLYGKLLSGIKLAGAINTVNKKALEVKVRFTKNGEDWLVIRGEKPKKFEIYRNDEKMDQYAKALDQQKFLDLILGMDYKLFTQIVVLNKTRYVPFMEMTTADRRKVVEDILDIAIFGEMNEVCKQAIREFQREETNLDKDREVKRAELDGQAKLIREIEDSIAAASESMQEELQEKRKQYDELGSKAKGIEEAMNAIALDGHEEVKRQIREYEKLADEFAAKITEKKKMAKFFNQYDHCPTCEQSITDELREEKAHEADDEAVRVQSIIGEMMEELEECAELNAEFERNSKRWTELQHDLQTTQFGMSSLESDIKRLLERSEKRSEDDKLESSTKAYLELQNALDAITERLGKTIEEREQYEQLRELLKDDGIKATIVREYSTLMNQRINEYLIAMDFYINMHLDENFKESFRAMHKENFAYENLSTGQATRVNLAIWLALLDVASVKNSVVTNILLLDEILENLDAEGVKDVMTLFKEKLPEKNIFVVTQRFDEFEDLFDSSIRFKQNSGFTEIEV